MGTSVPFVTEKLAHVLLDVAHRFRYQRSAALGVWGAIPTLAASRALQSNMAVGCEHKRGHMLDGAQHSLLGIWKKLLRVLRENLPSSDQIGDLRVCQFVRLCLRTTVRKVALRAVSVARLSLAWAIMLREARELREAHPL